VVTQAKMPYSQSKRYRPPRSSKEKRRSERRKALNSPSYLNDDTSNQWEAYPGEDILKDTDIDIYEYWSARELLDDPSAQFKFLGEIAAWTELADGSVQPYDPPEYRRPTPNLDLKKGQLREQPEDQGPDRDFKDEFAKQVAEYGTNPELLEDVDIVTTMPALRIFIAFVEGRLQDDMRSKGQHAKGGSEATRIDMIRVGRMPCAPKAISLSTTFTWSTNRFGMRSRDQKQRSFIPYLQAVVSNEKRPSAKEADDAEVVQPAHFRILKYEVGGLKIAVRARHYVIMPSVDNNAVDRPGMGVEVMASRPLNAGMLWDAKLRMRYAEMLFADTGMICRGIVVASHLADIQEVTRNDLELDRPRLWEETEDMLGRIVGFMRRVKEVAESPGSQNRPIWLQYANAEFRLISPAYPDDIEELFMDPTEENLAELRTLGYAD